MRSVLQCVRIVCGIWSRLMVSRVFVVEVAREIAAAAKQRDRERIRERRERSGDMWQRGSSGRERAEGKRVFVRWGAGGENERRVWAVMLMLLV
jgi:hypothetical protein